MRESQVRFFDKHMDLMTRRDRVFVNNPVVMQGLGLAPVVIAASTVQNAVVLGFAVLLLLTPTRMIATFIGQHTGFKFRAVLYAVVSGLVYIGVAFAVDRVFGSAAVPVGIYLPLLVMEPLILKRYESPKHERLSTSFKKGVITTIGFLLVLFLMAGLRELLAYGTFAGIEVFRDSLFPLAALPAGGFLLMGLVAAGWRGLVKAFKRKIATEVKHLP